MKKTFLFLGVMLVVAFGAYKFFDKQAPGIDRDPSSLTRSGQQQMIDQMNLRILSIQSRSQVKAVADEMIAIASASEAIAYPAVQMYAAVASLMPSLEGIIYRCRQFVEQSDWIHMSVLFGLRNFKYNDYLYGPHIEAIFDYLTYPSEQAGKPFRSVAELQDYLLFKVAPQIENFMKVAAQLEQLPPENFEFQFDRSILVGQKVGLRFIDPLETKKTFIKPYFYTVEFLLQRTLGTIYYVSALDLNELPMVSNRVLKTTTMNTFVGDLRLGVPVKGVTPMMTYETIKQARTFLNWRNKISNAGQLVETQTLLDWAFYYGQVSAQNQLAAYVCGLKYPYMKSRGQMPNVDKVKDCSILDQVGSTDSYFITEGSKYLFNPNSMILNFKKKYNAFRDRVRAFSTASQNRYAMITSDVTGKSLQVNVKAFFNAKVPPRDFLPTGYSASAAASASNIAGVSAWNYDHGKPLRFKDYTFGGFFNASEVRDSDSLYQAMATLLYTDAISPFAIFIRVPSPTRFFIPPSEIIRE